MLKKVEQSESWEERAGNAEVCLESLKLSVPTVIDGEDSRVNAAYAGWPDRMYVVGSDGRIAYQGGPGPGGFKPQEVEEWLASHVRPQVAVASPPTWSSEVPARRWRPGARLMRLLGIRR